MTESKMVPKIRFASFTGSWECRKFSDITYLSREKNRDDLPYESYSITNENGFVPQNEKFENGGTVQNADKRMYYIVSPQSFAYNPARINVGSIGYQNTSKNVIVSSLYEVFKTTAEVDDRFLWHWFKSEHFQKLIVRLQEGGVRLYFYYDKLCMGSVALPYIEEQRQIGVYLDKIDVLITLHQQKHDKLLALKKSMLEKMFPKAGSNVPEIRFAGFTAPWKQRKLSDMGEVITGSTPSPQHSEYYSEEGIPWVTPTDITENLLYETQKKLSPLGVQVSRVVPAGTVLVTCIASIGKNTMLVNAGSFNQQINGLVPDKQKHDPYFLLTESHHWSAKMMREAAAGTIQIVNKNEFSSIETYVPELPEQQVIGKYFRRLDDLIALYLRKYEKLKQLKQSLQEKMFV